MKIAIWAKSEQKQEWLEKFPDHQDHFIWCTKLTDLKNAHADLYIALAYNEFVWDIIADMPAFFTDQVVLVNAIVLTNPNLSYSFGKNVVRINGWPGFINRSEMEIATDDHSLGRKITRIFNSLKASVKVVPDIQGMVTPRIISMIVNEAYFALGDEVSTKEEIDTAMKLGTNYPFGPFEWGKKIGLEKIAFLIENLHKDEGDRYITAPFLLDEFNHM